MTKKVNLGHNQEGLGQKRWSDRRTLFHDNAQCGNCHTECGRVGNSTLGNFAGKFRWIFFFSLENFPNSVGNSTLPVWELSRGVWESGELSGGVWESGELSRGKVGNCRAECGKVEKCLGICPITVWQMDEIRRQSQKYS